MDHKTEVLENKYELRLRPQTDFLIRYLIRKLTKNKSKFWNEFSLILYNPGASKVAALFYFAKLNEK